MSDVFVSNAIFNEVLAQHYRPPRLKSEGWSPSVGIEGDYDEILSVLKVNSVKNVHFHGNTDSGTLNVGLFSLNDDYKGLEPGSKAMSRRYDQTTGEELFRQPFEMAAM